MTRKLGESDARFRLVIVDACRNDSNKRAIFKVRAASNARGLVKVDDAPKSVILLQSCQPGAYSYEGGDNLEHGVFTQSLLEAFDPQNSKANVNEDEELTFGEFFAYISNRTEELSKLEHKTLQRPDLTNEAGLADCVVWENLMKDGITDAQRRQADELYRMGLEEFTRRITTKRRDS